jgi:hypothetical protein
VRQVGSGSVTAGRKVIERFLERLHDEHGANNADEPEPEAEHQIIPQPDGNHGRYAKGGKVKMSKEAANYRDSAEDNKFCARCSMHLPRNNSCTLVAGPVHRVGLCDYFEKA